MIIRQSLKSFRALSVALVAVGLAVGIGPTLGLRISDLIIARDRNAAVDEWVRNHRAHRPPARSLVIEPGPDGYLLEIPKIGVRLVVRELEPEVFAGKNTPRLRRYGVGQLPPSGNLRNVSPGAEGTAAITGHRTTSGAPFRNIDRLRAGDLIIIQKGQTEQRWEVVYSATVSPKQVAAIASRPGIRRLVILACDPPFSARHRLIVYARPLQ